MIRAFSSAFEATRIPLRMVLVILAKKFFLQDLDLTVDHQDLGHLCVELGVAPLQVVFDFVGPKLGAGEQLGDGAPPKHGQAEMPGFRSVFSGVERQGPGCPELFGVAQVDGLRAGDSHEPGARLGLGRSPVLAHRRALKVDQAENGICFR